MSVPPAAAIARQLSTLESLLSLSVVDLKLALEQSSDIIANAFGADKVDAFLYDPERDTLVAIGSSSQPLSALQKKHGLDVLPVSNGGRAVETYVTGASFVSGRIADDPGELRGIKEALRVRSEIAVALDVLGQRRGVLLLAGLREDQWTEGDARFAESVGHWLSAVVHQAELVTQMQKSAVAAGRRSAAEDLITVVAHDLRNFIYPIDLLVQVIARRAEKDGRSEDVRDTARARRALSRLNGLVTDILDVARIEQDALRVDVRPTALVPLAEEIGQVLGTPEQPVVVIAKEEVIALVDPPRIRQCIENLVTNAIKHSPKLVPVSIEVSRNETEAGPIACVAVVDQGPGVAPEILPHIFDRFVSQAGPKNRAGLGLGLFLARSIAQLHGGELAVEAPRTQGARFVLTLPSTEVGS